jgi:hypothetical protein
METKNCKKCGGAKPLEGFYAHAMMADGHLNICKECCKAGAKARRDANIEEHRAKDRLRGFRPSNNINVDAAREKRREWGKRNRHKTRAHLQVKRAIAAGILTRQSCEVCATTDAVHAHHDDYSKPLDVKWLCMTHHAARHVEMREAVRPDHMRREAVATRLPGRGPKKKAA